MKKASLTLFLINIVFTQITEASSVSEDLLKQMYKTISKPSPRRIEANPNNAQSSPEPSLLSSENGPPRKSAFSPRLKNGSETNSNNKN